ncbi:MAG: hypothetical protein ACRYFX_10850 [Janthinobacterium lividum]
MTPTRTTEQFIEQARAQHGEKYNYSQTEYIRSTHKVIIVCPMHGEFEQVAQSHLRGRGCSRCGQGIPIAMHEVKRQEAAKSFITRARAVHGDKYDYSKVDYVDSVTKIVIGCPQHGDFEQQAGSHMFRGCRSCGRDGLRTKLEDFIKAARQIHGDKYDYTSTTYLSARKQVLITCPKHGTFSQQPALHLRGANCRRCHLEKLFAPRLKQFITRARAVHGDKYDYSKVDYVDSVTKIVIGCPQHGDFEQKPTGHLNTTGCPACGKEQQNAAARLDWAERAGARVATLYFLKVFSKKESFYKVGITFLTIAKRYRAAKLLGGYQYEVLAQYKSINAIAVYDWEQSIIETFSHLAYTPKCRFGGDSECFISADEILNIFPL